MSAMEVTGAALVALPVLLLMYAYLGYPLLLRAAGRREEPEEPASPSRGEREADGWPRVTLLVPAYNEAENIRGTLEDLLALDYPEERRQILVVSDASTDGTDEIVREFSSRGVELLRLDRRRGKTRAQAEAVPRMRGDVVVNVDASVSVPPGALRPLVRPFRDPAVGVVSGRDVSVGSRDDAAGSGEGSYVGYEMWIRELESRTGGIVGASGCFYAVRREIFSEPVPEDLSRDFCSVLTAREMGYRAVSARDAVCEVPRSDSLRGEFTRKTRTLTRGLHTLFFKRGLLNPFRSGAFALKLLSHKVCRWAAPLAMVGAIPGAALLGVSWATVAAATLGGGALAALLIRGEARLPLPKAVRFVLYGVAANAAAVVAWRNLILGRAQAVWEPTRRPAVGG